MEQIRVIGKEQILGSVVYGRTASDELMQIIAKMMDDDKTLAYGVALTKAQIKNPNLAMEVFEEMTGAREKRSSASDKGAATERLEQLVAKMMDDDKTLAYGVALTKAQIKNPNLAMEVFEEMTNRR